MDIEVKMNEKGDGQNPRHACKKRDEKIVIDSSQMKHITLTDRILQTQEMSNKPLPTETYGSEGEVYQITYEANKVERGNWGGKVDFILTCVSFAVGLGNVWRFPFLVYKNGGGAFLIPYVLMLIFVGLPIFFLEFAFGQFSSLGPISCWIISPLFKGVGYGMVLITWYLTLYYNVIISHCLFYLVSSMTTELPWRYCGNLWNDPTTCYDGTNITEHIKLGNGTLMTPAEQYYDNYVLQVSNGIENFGLPSWKLLLCLFISWLIVALVLIKGVQSLGKISYFTAFFPYIMLTILLIRSSFLEGSLNGIIFYLTPRFHRLKDASVWTDAATQIFFSLSCCNGGLINIASYNKFKNNCCRDAVIVAIINCATSVFAGFVIFTNLGFMAHVKNTTIEAVAKGGPGLAFVVYPEALINMPISPMWAIFFFFMMVTLGYGSQFSMVETVISGFQDELRRMGIVKSVLHSRIFRISVCVIGFVLGIPMVCPGGIYLLTLLDWTVSGYPLLILGLLEILIICYFYGINQFKKDIALMTKSRPNWYFRSTWLFITPCIMTFLLIFYFVAGSELEYGNYKYPKSWKFFAQFVALVPVICVVILFLFRYCKDGGWILLKEYMKPQQDWGPAVEEDRKEFMEMIKSNESIRRKNTNIRQNIDEENAMDSLAVEGLNEDDTKFFQSKHSIIEKLCKVVNKEQEKVGSGSEFVLNRSNVALSDGGLKLIQSSGQLNSNNRTSQDASVKNANINESNAPPSY